MKKGIVFILLALLGIGAETTQAQATAGTQPLLKAYYAIKNALVAGAAADAAAQAAVFSKELSAKDSKSFPAGVTAKLATNAKLLADSKDLAKQRTVFMAFSTDMATLAKAVKLSAAPVYVDYCPMKKAVWLSEDEDIKNPYFGNAMLSCGNVSDTIQP